jgi:outer membrane receptor protein involved in Fe transport
MLELNRPSRFGQAHAAIILGVATCIAGAPAMAQQPGNASERLEEIVVSATKVGEQELSKVPMAIQAFSGESLLSRGVADAKTLMELIPGASEQSEIGAGYKVFSFRGSGAGGPIGDGMIGYYLDDTPFGIPNFQSAPPIQYFDLDRIEVLRGPQGTLYGQGSMGGAIIYHTKNPSLSQLTFDGEAGTSKTAESGDLNYKVAAAVSVPLLTDRLGLRVSGGYDYRAGYADVYQGAPTGAPFKTDANDIRSSDAQAVLLWTPTDRLTLRLRAWQFQTNQDYLQVMNSLDPPYVANQGSVDGYDRRKSNYYSNTITYRFDRVTLTNASSYQESLPGGFGVGLGLGPPLGVGTLVNGGHAHNFVNEFRLSSSGEGAFHWVGGAFYQNATGFYTFGITFPTLTLSGETITRTQNKSVFTELSYDLFGGKLVPLIGLRYFEDDRDSLSVSNGVPAASSSKPNKVTWRANLAYHVTDEWMLFVNAGTGFRSGILQSRAQADAVIADGVPSGLALTPDQLRNIELGTKLALADGRLRLATSVYDIRYTNLQSAFNTSIGLAAFANLGDAKTQGIDLDVTWYTPLEGLSVSVVGNANKGEFTDVVPAFAQANPRNADGTRLFNTPPHNWRMDLGYDRDIGGAGWQLFANASASVVGSARVQDATVNTVKSYSLYRASIGMRKAAYEVSLYGDNLLDERGPTAANGPTLLAGPYPRTVGFLVRYRMDRVE